MVERRRLTSIVGEVARVSINPTYYGGVNSFYRMVEGWGINLCGLQTVRGSETLLLRVFRASNHERETLRNKASRE